MGNLEQEKVIIHTDKVVPMKNKPDLYQFTARFGCGFIFGLFAGTSCYFVFGATTMAGLFWGWVIFSVMFGLLSVIFGDRFWTKIYRWFL
ncbi:hypothetical protein CK510_09170 [Brunnivagina elsteri CCALA 953]|uniref:Uncharacterized protein n=2 Tax=Brunnivagina TaxID=3344733 RepID=A0A2A2TKQ7_9CYAN|nr:hypothetical protein CK510_09170 [Calothrix elsteri CCALA 953]